jgi:hypothetical protein
MLYPPNRLQMLMCDAGKSKVAPGDLATATFDGFGSVSVKFVQE